MNEFENLNFLQEEKYQNMTLEEKKEWLDKLDKYWDDDEKIKKVPRNENGKFITEYGRFFGSIHTEMVLTDSKLKRKRYEEDAEYRAEEDARREEWRRNYRERFTAKEKREITQEWQGYFPDMNIINTYFLGRFIGPFFMGLGIRTRTFRGAGYSPYLYARNFAANITSVTGCDYKTDQPEINYQDNKEERIRWMNYIRRSFAYRTEGEFTLDDIKGVYDAKYYRGKNKNEEKKIAPDHMIFIASWAGEMEKAEEYYRDVFGDEKKVVVDDDEYFMQKAEERWLSAREIVIKQNSRFTTGSIYESIRISPSDLDNGEEIKEKLFGIYKRSHLKSVEDFNERREKVWNIIKDPELVRNLVRENFKKYKEQQPKDKLEKANIQPIKGAKYQGTILD